MAASTRCRERPEGDDDEVEFDRKRWWSAAFVGRYTTISRDYCLENQETSPRPLLPNPGVYHDPEKMDCTMTTTMDIRIHIRLMYKIIYIIINRRTRRAATAWAAAVATAVSCARRTPFIKKKILLLFLYAYYYYYDA